MSLLEIKELHTHFGLVRAVDDVSMSFNKGETVAIVGGSGSGKTVLALSILGLVPEGGKIVSGEILYKGRELTKLSLGQLRQIRGKDIAMIFQEPMTSLNPVFTIGDQIEEVICVHEVHDASKASKTSKVIEFLGLVGIPQNKFNCYPHELSGGQRQRVMIAIALACNPDILIADEPTTALDVTIQAQILDLLADLQARFGMTVILITHDFGIVAQTADRVYVMHEGRVVEEGRTLDIFKQPKKEYTKKLLAAVPVL